MAQSSTDNGPNPLIIFVLLSVVIVVLGMVGFIVLIVASTSSAGGSQLLGDGGPYNLAQRIVPDDDTPPKVLLPTQIGTFKRDILYGDLQDFKMTYTSGDYKINLEGSQEVNISAAQAAVADVSRVVGLGAAIKRQLNQDPSYFLVNKDGTIRFSWSHGRWFYDIKANSQQALDEFMKGFKY
ncbi:MAG: hypothetical protein ABI947_05260 [Chloroflexota bacterium]